MWEERERHVGTLATWPIQSQESKQGWGRWLGTAAQMAGSVGWEVMVPAEVGDWSKGKRAGNKQQVSWLQIKQDNPDRRA